MALQIGQGEDAITVSMFPTGDKISIGEYEFTIEQFCSVAAYVMTISDLVVGDPRFELVDLISQLQVVNGWGAKLLWV